MWLLFEFLFIFGGRKFVNDTLKRDVRFDTKIIATAEGACEAMQAVSTTITKNMMAAHRLYCIFGDVEADRTPHLFLPRAFAHLLSVGFVCVQGMSL